MLYVATLFDIRFKGHACLKDEKGVSARRSAKEMALQMFADKARVMERKEYPDSTTLAALAGEVARDAQAASKRRQVSAKPSAKARASQPQAGIGTTQRQLQRQSLADEFLFGPSAPERRAHRKVEDLAMEEELLLWDRVCRLLPLR